MVRDSVGKDFIRLKNQMEWEKECQQQKITHNRINNNNNRIDHLFSDFAHLCGITDIVYFHFQYEIILERIEWNRANFIVTSTPTVRTQ